MDALSNLDQKTFQQKISYLEIAKREEKNTHTVAMTRTKRQTNSSISNKTVDEAKLTAGSKKN
jgi:hypothetical protein